MRDTPTPPLSSSSLFGREGILSQDGMVEVELLKEVDFRGDLVKLMDDVP